MSSSKLYGKVVVIKRDGQDGAIFPMHTKSITIGRMPACDIRVQLPTVSRSHCRLSVNANQQVILTNLSNINPAQLNGKMIRQEAPVYHADILQVDDRFFRFEYPSNSVFMHIPKSADVKHFARNMIDVLSNQQEEEQDPIGEDHVLKTVKKPRKSMASSDYKSPGKEALMSSGKRISFAAKAISPEIIDKNLPASQPVKRGSIPASPVPSKVRKSLLRTPGTCEPLRELNESNEGRSSSVGVNSSSAKRKSEPARKSKSVSPHSKKLARKLVNDENVDTSLDASGIENSLAQRKIITPNRRSRVSIRTDSPDSSLDSITVFLTPDGRTPAANKVVPASIKSKFQTPWMSNVKGLPKVSPKDPKVPTPKSQNPSPGNKKSPQGQIANASPAKQTPLSPMTKKSLVARSSVAPTPRATNMRVELLKKTLNKSEMVGRKSLNGNGPVRPKSAKAEGRKSTLMGKKVVLGKTPGSMSWADIAKKRLTPKAKMTPQAVVSKIIKGKRTFKVRTKPAKRNVVHQDMTPDLVIQKPVAVVKPIVSSVEKRMTPSKSPQIPKVNSPGVQKLTKTTPAIQKAVLENRKELIVRSLTSKTPDKSNVEIKSLSGAEHVKSPLQSNSTVLNVSVRDIPAARQSLNKLDEGKDMTVKANTPNNTPVKVPSAQVSRLSSVTKVANSVKAEPSPKPQSSGNVKVDPKRNSASKTPVKITVTPKRMSELKTPTPKIVPSPRSSSAVKTPLTKVQTPKTLSDSKSSLKSETKQPEAPVSAKKPSPRSRSVSKTPINVATPGRLRSASRTPGSVASVSERTPAGKSLAKKVTPIVKTEATPKNKSTSPGKTVSEKISPEKSLPRMSYIKSPAKSAETPKEETPAKQTPQKQEQATVSSAVKSLAGRSRSASKTPIKAAEVPEPSSESKLAAKQVKQITGGSRKSKSMSPKLDGLRKLLRTPKTVQSPRLSGIASLLKTPVVAAVVEVKTTAKKVTPMKSPVKATPQRSTRTRTRRGAKVEEPETDVQVEQVEVSSKKVSKRGAPKSVEKEVTPAKSPKVASPVKTRTRKGRAVKIVEPPVEKSPLKSLPAEEKPKSPAKVSPKPKRATRGKKADASKEPIETPAESNSETTAKTPAKALKKTEEVIETASRSTRTRRGKATEEPVSVLTAEKTPEKKSQAKRKAKTPAEKSPVMKSALKNSPTVAEVVEVEVPTRSTRTRRGKAVEPKAASPVEKSPEKRKSPPKEDEPPKKTKKVESKAVEEESASKVSPVKTRKLRGKARSPSPAKSPVAVPAPSAKTSRKKKETEVVVEVAETPKKATPPRKTRRGVKASPKKAMSPVAPKSKKATKSKSSPGKNTISQEVVASPPKTRSLRNRKK